MNRTFRTVLSFSIIASILIAVVFIIILSSGQTQGQVSYSGYGTALAVATQLRVINLSNNSFGIDSELIGGSGIDYLGCSSGMYTVRVVSQSSGLVINQQDVYVGMAQEVVVTIHQNDTITSKMTDHYVEIMQKYFTNATWVR
jgi:hypothetical protein